MTKLEMIDVVLKVPREVDEVLEALGFDKGETYQVCFINGILGLFHTLPEGAPRIERARGILETLDEKP